MRNETLSCTLPGDSSQSNEITTIKEELSEEEGGRAMTRQTSIAGISPAKLMSGTSQDQMQGE